MAQTMFTFIASGTKTYRFRFADDTAFEKAIFSSWCRQDLWYLQAHHDLRHNMRRSLFCVVLPGDTASSRRLTEAVLAGCIPVFTGSPWSSMALATEINYRQIALLFQLDAFQ